MKKLHWLADSMTVDKIFVDKMAFNKITVYFVF